MNELLKSLYLVIFGDDQQKQNAKNTLKDLDQENWGP